jgi:hypothetical protein
MTQDEIIEMAEKAKLDKQLADDYCRVEYWTATEDELIAFAKLVAAKEREACAELCIELAPSTKTMTAYKVLHEASKAILARGQA